MDLAHIKLQFKRLNRHYSFSLEKKDEVAFLDLAHTLRVFSDMKNEIDKSCTQLNFICSFSNTLKNNEISKILKGSKYFSIPLSAGVESPNMQVKGITIIGKALTSEEVKSLYEAGPPVSIPTNLSFSQWLGANIIDTANPDNEDQPKRSISRYILIKRVANILGASHPAGAEAEDDSENSFDPYVYELHGMKVADGYPLTYYQLLGIAEEMIEVFNPIFGDINGGQPL